MLIHLVTNSLILIVVYILSETLAVNYFNNDNTVVILRLLAIAFFVDSFVQTLRFSFQGFKKMLYFSGIDVIRMLLILIFLIVGFKLNYGILSPAIAYIIVPIILVLFCGYIFIRKVFKRFSTSKVIFKKTLLKRISAYSMYLMAIAAGGVVLGYTDIVMLTYFSGLTSVALYSVALPTARVLTYFPKAIAGVLIPISSELWSKKKFNLLKAGIQDLYKYSLIVLVPTVLVIFSFAEIIVNLLFGEKFILAATALRILSIGMIFHIIYSINSDFFSGIGHPKIITKMVYFTAVFNVIGNIILIPILGISGAAITTSAGYFIMMVFGLIKIRMFVDIEFPWRAWIKTILIGGIFVYFITLLKKLLMLNVWLETVIVLLLSGLLYVLLLFIFKVLNKKEINILLKRIL